ncbi:MAG TPA: hypothetical protein VN436_11505 [Holophaga sp.]|nr:hypothetical protein [Holophaga sp.]
MESDAISRGRIAGAAIVVLLLNLAGVVWLGISQELTRTELAQLARTTREAPAPALPTGLETEVKATRDAVAKLAAKVDALIAGDDAKAVSRLTVEVKNLANRVEALATAKAAPAKESKPGLRRPNEEDAPRPFFGPGYPAYPGY